MHVNEGKADAVQCNASSALKRKQKREKKQRKRRGGGRGRGEVAGGVKTQSALMNTERYRVIERYSIEVGPYTFRDIFDVDHIPVPRIVPPQHETTNSKNKEIPNQPPEINNPFDESKPLNKEKEGTAISTELNIITKSSATKIYASPDVMLKKRHLKETSHYLNSLGMNSVNPKNSLTLSEKKSSLRNDGCSSTHAPESIYRPSGKIGRASCRERVSSPV